jgi:glucokinase
LLNDLEATAYAVSALGEGELRCLSTASRPEPGRPRAVIAAGTGLGMAIMTAEPDGFRPSASEGGHVEFAPQDELEIDLLRFLKRDLEHVSIERLVSGPGLVRLYDFFCDRGELTKNETLAERVRAAPDSAPAAVARAALSSECPVATAALDLFVKQYGAVAGNLALTAYATGGLYLAGGIAPKILQKLEDGTFMRSFTAKGRLRPLTERVPVFVLLNEQAPLYGAAHFAKMALASLCLIAMRPPPRRSVRPHVPVTHHDP